MDVILSSDDNYAQHLGVTIYSLLVHNQELDSINIWVVDNAISVSNKQKLSTLVSDFPNVSLQWLDFSKWKSNLNLHFDSNWTISLSSYARLFIASMLPQEVERVLYLDCDIVVNDSLKSLWECNLDHYVVAAVQDDISNSTKEAVGVQGCQQYFNTGMLLINLHHWRELEIEKRCLSFIAEKNGQVKHHDQGVLNGVLKDYWLRLPLGYNLMTIHFMFNRNKILRYYQENAEFYTEEAIKEAKKHPKILHFTPSFTSRPWVKGCKHPMAGLYWEMLSHTPWKGAKPELDKSKWTIKLVNWRYRNLPF